MIGKSGIRKPGYDFLTSGFERIVDTDLGALSVHAHSLDVGQTVHAGVSGLVDYQIRNRQGKWRFAYEPEIIDPALSVALGIDFVTAGPPCQGHSNLNNHTRRQDPRNDLFICTVAVPVALSTKAILIENVPPSPNPMATAVKRHLFSPG